MIFVLTLLLSLTADARKELTSAIQSQLKGSLPSAEAGYRSVLDESPDFVPARIYLAETLWLEGRQDEAREVLEDVAATHSELLVVEWLRWHFGEDIGSNATLIRRLEEVYPFERQRFIATGTAALILLTLGEAELAVEDFRRASELDPEDAPLHRQLGVAFAKARLSVPAIEAFERVVAVTPEETRAWKELGSSYLVLQRWQSAIDAFEQVLERDGDDVGVLLAQGYAYERLTNFDEAQKRYRKAARLAPSAYQPHFRMGRAYLAQHELGRAERSFRKACELDPSVSQPRRFLGELYLKKNDLDKAVESLREAIALDPESFEAYYHLAQAYRRLGRTEDAQAAIESYATLKEEQRAVPSKEKKR